MPPLDMPPLDMPPLGGRRPQARSDALAFDLPLELIDRLLGILPEGVHLQQLLECLQCPLLLADLAQDLAQAIERLVVMRIERQRAAKVAQSALDVIQHEVDI